MDIRVASRYAKALFNAALKQNIVASVGADMEAVNALLSGNARFSKFLTDPDVPRGDKRKLLDSVLSDRTTGLTLQLLQLVLEKRREEEIPMIVEQYAALQREHEEIIQVNITSAKPLDESQIKAIIAKIEAETKKKVAPTMHVDANVMGGVKIELGGFVQDGTVAGSLSRLREQLVYKLLKQV